MKKIFLPLLTMAMGLVMTACGGSTDKAGRDAQELAGAGATFPLPFYNVVFEQFGQQHGDAVAYGGIGSGGFKLQAAVSGNRPLLCPKRNGATDCRIGKGGSHGNLRQGPAGPHSGIGCGRNRPAEGI